MVATPTVPVLSSGQSLSFSGLLEHLPISIQLTPVALLMCLVLAGIVVATLSVVLVYHWRRFPFEHDLFRRVERWYWVGVILLIATALAGIIAAS